MPRAPMLPPIMILPWAMALAAPLPALPRTVISAPALSQPISSEVGPSMMIFVPGKPMAPARCPGEPLMRTVMGSSRETNSRPPMPCWPSASTKSSRAPWVTARWMRSSRMRDSTRWPFSMPCMVTLCCAMMLPCCCDGVRCRAD